MNANAWLITNYVLMVAAAGATAILAIIVIRRMRPVAPAPEVLRSHVMETLKSELFSDMGGSTAHSAGAVFNIREDMWRKVVKQEIDRRARLMAKASVKKMHTAALEAIYDGSIRMRNVAILAYSDALDGVRRNVSAHDGGNSAESMMPKAPADMPHGRADVHTVLFYITGVAVFAFITWLLFSK